MSARDEYPLAWQIARSRAHEDTWGEVVSALEEIDRLRAERDTLVARRDEIMRESGRSVEKLVRQIDRVRELCDRHYGYYGYYGYAATVTAIKAIVGDAQSSGLDKAGPGGAVEAERRQDQPEPCDTAAPRPARPIR